MPAAPASSPRRPRPGSSPSAASRGSSRGNRWLWIVAALLLLAGGYLLWTRRASASGLSTSGNPRRDLTGSDAQQPNGGAASVPGNLPPFLVSQPDALQTQVQQAQGGSPESASMIDYVSYGSGPTYTSRSFGGSVEVPGLAPYAPVGTLGGDTYVASHPQSVFTAPVNAFGDTRTYGSAAALNTVLGENIHRGGFQI